METLEEHSKRKEGRHYLRYFKFTREWQKIDRCFNWSVYATQLACSNFVISKQCYEDFSSHPDQFYAPGRIKRRMNLKPYLVPLSTANQAPLPPWVQAVGGPTTASNDNEVEEFFEELESTLIVKSTCKVVIGDFNVKLG